MREFVIVVAFVALALMLLNNHPSRLECHLRAVTAAEIVDCLDWHYPEVKFTVCPAENSFYAEGSSEDLAEIQRQVSLLDMPRVRPAAPSSSAGSNEVKICPSPLRLGIRYSAIDNEALDKLETEYLGFPVL